MQELINFFENLPNEYPPVKYSLLGIISEMYNDQRNDIEYPAVIAEYPSLKGDLANEENYWAVSFTVFKYVEKFDWQELRPVMDETQRIAEQIVFRLYSLFQITKYAMMPVVGATHDHVCGYRVELVIQFPAPCSLDENWILP